VPICSIARGVLHAGPAEGATAASRVRLAIAPAVEAERTTLLVGPAWRASPAAMAAKQGERAADALVLPIGNYVATAAAVRRPTIGDRPDASTADAIAAGGTCRTDTSLHSTLLLGRWIDTEAVTVAAAGRAVCRAARRVGEIASARAGNALVTVTSTIRGWRRREDAERIAVAATVWTRRRAAGSIGDISEGCRVTEAAIGRTGRRTQGPGRAGRCVQLPKGRRSRTGVLVRLDGGSVGRAASAVAVRRRII
jgi:hypothetical protein